jgi:hypothetical protein
MRATTAEKTKNLNQKGMGFFSTRGTEFDVVDSSEEGGGANLTPQDGQ